LGLADIFGGFTGGGEPRRVRGSGEVASSCAFGRRSTFGSISFADAAGLRSRLRGFEASGLETGFFFMRAVPDLNGEFCLPCQFKPVYQRKQRIFLGEMAGSK
jgi:hypothetical protein